VRNDLSEAIHLVRDFAFWVAAAQGQPGAVMAAVAGACHAGEMP